MSFWEVLEIEPTDDIKVIKKAYAKKLKIIDSDNDIEAFQSLKEAYDDCIAFVKRKNNSNKNKELKDKFNDDFIHSSKELNSNYKVEEENIENPHEKFKVINNDGEMSGNYTGDTKKYLYHIQIEYELNKYANMIFNFDNLDFWKKATEQYMSIVDIDRLKEIQKGVFNFLCHDYYLLSNRVINYLISIFGINKNEFINSIAIDEVGKFYILQPINLTVNFLSNFKGVDLNEYLKCKISAYKFYYDNNLGAAYREIINCKKEAVDDDILQLELILILNEANSLHRGISRREAREKYSSILKELLPDIKARINDDSSSEFKYVVLCVCNYLEIPVWFNLDFIDKLYQKGKEKDILKAYYLKKDFDLVISFYNKNKEFFDSSSSMELSIYIKNAFKYQNGNSKNKDKVSCKNDYKNLKNKNPKAGWIRIFFVRRKVQIIILFFLIIILPYGFKREIYLNGKYVYNISSSKEDIIKNYDDGDYAKKRETSIFYKPLSDIGKEKDKLLSQYTVLSKEDYMYTVHEKGESYNEEDKNYFINISVGGEIVTVYLRDSQLDVLFDEDKSSDINRIYDWGITDSEGDIYFIGEIEKTKDVFSKDAIEKYKLGEYSLRATGSNEYAIKEKLDVELKAQFILFILILLIWSFIYKRRVFK